MCNPPLRIQGKVDFNSQPEIEDSIRGVEYSYVYTGKRQAPRSDIIEIHITSTVRDWAQQTYIRKAWYMGHKGHWKKCIQDHIRDHLTDLQTGSMLVMRLMRDFEIKEGNYQTWEKYEPTYFRT